jgi:hypothetical protein
VFICGVVRIELPTRIAGAVLTPNFGKLLTDIELFEDSLIAFWIFIFQEIQKTPSLTYHFQKPSAGMMILRMTFEMFRKRVDAFCKNGYLNFRGARIRRVGLVRADNLGLTLFRQHETLFSFFFLETRIIQKRPRISNNRAKPAFGGKKKWATRAGRPMNGLGFDRNLASFRRFSLRQNDFENSIFERSGNLVRFHVRWQHKTACEVAIEPFHTCFIPGRSR